MLEKHLEELQVEFLTLVTYNFFLNMRDRHLYNKFPVKHHIDYWQSDLIDIIDYYLKD